MCVIVFLLVPWVHRNSDMSKVLVTSVCSKVSVTMTAFLLIQTPILHFIKCFCDVIINNATHTLGSLQKNAITNKIFYISLVMGQVSLFFQIFLCYSMIMLFTLCQPYYTKCNISTNQCLHKHVLQTHRVEEEICISL